MPYNLEKMVSVLSYYDMCVTESSSFPPYVDRHMLNLVNYYISLFLIISHIDLFYSFGLIFIFFLVISYCPYGFCWL